MAQHKHDVHKPCAPVPDLRRLNYFFGQMLGVDDFRSEQSYFREKHKLHNRCLHGYGTVCGLLVKPAPPQKECRSEQDGVRARLQQEIESLERELRDNPNLKPEEQDKLKRRLEELHRQLDQLPEYCPLPAVRSRVVVDCGMALDCEGNEIIVRRAETIDLWERLSPEEREQLRDGQRHDLWLSICFCEKPVSPVRPVQEDACEPKSDCVFGKLQDSYRFKVSLTRPDRDRRCEPCCSGCEECCLLLARIDQMTAEGNLDERQVDNDVRRRIGLYESTRIEGINWTHGATYEVEEVDDLLGGRMSGHEKQGGLMFQTSHKVRVETLRRGVADIWVIRGGRGSRAEIYNLDSKIIPVDAHDGYTRRFRVRSLSDEKLSNGDRVLVTLRSAFILDRCCQPVDGVNVGGFVPMLPDEQFRRFRKHMPEPACDRDIYGPPRSGIGIPGGSAFESWFYVRRRDEGGHHMTEHYDDDGLAKGE